MEMRRCGCRQESKNLGGVRGAPSLPPPTPTPHFSVPSWTVNQSFIRPVMQSLCSLSLSHSVRRPAIHSGSASQSVQYWGSLSSTPLVGVTGRRSLHHPGSECAAGGVRNLSVGRAYAERMAVCAERAARGNRD
ncbi:hypothetical protein E2C01_081257 [Portunus trituberculatus]|uniref:Uncharacterized protein n=1 Tax=Portunus trituberculatus TaxID=210409 RepID=A0A5B7IPA2_PORTR|nr:hypothetical protein [Portunus trituberculatus]